MPGVKKNVSLAKTLGAKVAEAHKAHKDKPADAGNAKLPPGIEGGIAKLVEVRIDEFQKGDNKGKPYFMARGVVRLPVTHEGTPCRGRHTQVGPIALCDTTSGTTKVSFQENYGKMLNHLKLLGVDTAATEDLSPEEVDEFLGNAMEELVSPENPTFFTFRTWKGSKSEAVQRGGKWYVMQGTSTKAGPYASEEELKQKNPWVGKDPRVTEEWNGRCDPPEGEGEVDAGGAMADESGGPAPDEAPAPDETPAPDEAAAPDAAAEEGPDLDALAAEADKDPNGKTAAGKAACKTLIDLGIAAGLDTATIKNADSWADVAKMIVEASTPADEAGEATPDETAPDEVAPSEDETAPVDDTPSEPVKGSVVKWCWKKKDGNPMLDPKTKKPLKPSDHEVLTVNMKNQTVTLKNLTTEKPIVKDGKPHHIPWAELE